MKLSTSLVTETGLKSTTELANSLGCTASAICQWKKIPPFRILQIHKLYGLPIEELEKLSAKFSS